VKEKVQSIAEGNIDAETLRRAREALVKTFEQSMENNLFIARNYANFEALLGTPLSHLAERPELYRSVTAEQVRELAAKALEKGPSEMILLPETADNGEDRPSNQRQRLFMLPPRRNP
jgi:predicted Zn-dependent peptidase